MFTRMLAFISVLSLFALLGCTTSTGVPPEAATAATTGINVANELCSLDLSSAPTVVAAANKYAQKPLEYARKICADVKLAEPYARLLGTGAETAGLVSPLEEARQRAVERGQAAGVL